jgi:hypothetical protein
MSATLVANSGIAAVWLVVPQMGSTSHTRWAYWEVEGVPSSPTNAMSG